MNSLARMGRCFDVFGAESSHAGELCFQHRQVRPPTEGANLRPAVVRETFLRQTNRHIAMPGSRHVTKNSSFNPLLWIAH